MFLQEFFQAIFDELRHVYEEYLSFDGPTDRLRKKLRIMYGRGEIGREKFYQLSNMLDRGYYVEGELMSLHHQAQNRMGVEGRMSDRAYNFEIARGLDTVYLNRAMLEEVRSEMQTVLKAVGAQRQWTEQQAQDFWTRAQAALPDETAARSYLEIRQQLLDHLQLLNQRLKTMQQDLDKINALDAQVRLYETELMIVDSRERLATVEVSVHRRLRS